MTHRDTVVQDMYRLVEESGKPVAIDGYLLRSGQWHNPAKGETHNGEMERWLNYITVVWGIIYYYDIQKDVYIFTKIKP